MKNNYKILLTNEQGATFDSETFTNLKEAKKWSSGRGETFNFGKWHKYTVTVFKNEEFFSEYKTK